MKINIKKTITLLIVTFLAFLPFIYVTNIIGLDIFLDSFENSNYYIIIQDKENILQSNTDGDYLIIQKSSHPDFEIEESDTIFYSNFEGDILYTKINYVTSIAAIKRYYIDKQNEEKDKDFIFENQILGKIIRIIDNSIFNSITVKIWDTSIHNFNLRAFLIKN